MAGKEGVLVHLGDGLEFGEAEITMFRAESYRKREMQREIRHRTLHFAEVGFDFVRLVKA